MLSPSATLITSSPPLSGWVAKNDVITPLTSQLNSPLSPITMSTKLPVVVTVSEPIPATIRFSPAPATIVSPHVGWSTRSVLSIFTITLPTVAPEYRIEPLSPTIRSTPAPVVIASPPSPPSTTFAPSPTSMVSTPPCACPLVWNCWYTPAAVQSIWPLSPITRSSPDPAVTLSIPLPARTTLFPPPATIVSSPPNVGSDVFACNNRVVPSV